MLLEFPPLNYLQLQKLAKLVQAEGWGFTLASSTETEFRQKAKDLVITKGPTWAVGWGSINEEVLPDGQPRSVLVEQIRLKLALCEPTHSFTLIDPYIFSKSADAYYADDLEYLLASTARKCAEFLIVTKASRDSVLEADVISRLIAINPGLAITRKYSDVFHDRFWISDGNKGIFVGTSPNGLGKRYALVDFLMEDDAHDIAARAQQLA